MSGYTYGTSALKIEKNTSQKKKTTRGVSKKELRKNFGNNILSIVVITALAFVLLTRYAVITEKTAKLAALKADYETASSVVVQKEFNMEREVDLKKIEEIATTKLDMQRPEKHQMVYIAMNNSDYTETVEAVKIHRTGFFASIAGSINNIVEYFR